MNLQRKLIQSFSFIKDHLKWLIDLQILTSFGEDFHKLTCLR